MNDRLMSVSLLNRALMRQNVLDDALIAQTLRRRRVVRLVKHTAVALLLMSAVIAVLFQTGMWKSIQVEKDATVPAPEVMTRPVQATPAQHSAAAATPVGPSVPAAASEPTNETLHLRLQSTLKTP